MDGQGLVRPEAVPAWSDRGLRRARRREPVGGDERGPRDPRRAPGLHGSLGIAISEAVEAAASRDDTKYSLGSVLNHVLMHQTVIGQEAQMQLDEAEDYPDVVIGCTGGGSNFSGLSFPFIWAALREARIRVIAVEPAACPSLTKGLYAFDFGDTGHLTPLVKMHTLGSTFIPPLFHAGGLRYHGMAPLVSHLHELGLIEARAYTQTEVFAAGVEFACIEGFSAPEANHAVKATIDEAVRCREEGVSEAILFNLCGHGHFDMQAYIDYFAGKLEDHAHFEDEVAMALAGLLRSWPLSRRAAELLGPRVLEPCGRYSLGCGRGGGSGHGREECGAVDLERADLRLGEDAGRSRYPPQESDLADAFSRPARSQMAAVDAHFDLSLRDQHVSIPRIALTHQDVARSEGDRHETFGQPVERGQRKRREERISAQQREVRLRVARRLRSARDRTPRDHREQR